jgi:MFS family permease
MANPDFATPSPWPAVALLYATGLVAAAQLGKLSSLAPLLVDDLRLPLTTMAWTISLLELGGATLGAVAGWMAQRAGLVRGLRTGLLALALAGLGQAMVNGSVGLIAWRLLEALGYLAVIVTAPVLLARHTARWGVRTQAMALTLWSTFVPVGLALGAGLAAALAQAWEWRAALAGCGLLSLAVALAVAQAPLVDAPPHAGAPTAEKAEKAEASEPAPRAAGLAEAQASKPAAGCLAMAFGLFALFEVGLLAMLPTLLVREAAMAPAAAGTWTGVVSLAAVPGSLMAAWLVRRGVQERWPAMLGLGLPPLLLFGVFRQAPDPVVAVALAVAISVLGGVFASLAFALLPRVAGDHAGLVRANGLLAQCGAGGSLLGPPAVAACVQAGGWPVAAWAALLVSVAALPLLWVATRGRPAEVVPISA